NSANPTTESKSLVSCSSMADQRFDYSKTAAESSWEPGGTLQLKQKIEDSAKAKS
ncbi:unnamed protein product, partial [Musa acuminata var. zebrina]